MNNPCKKLGKEYNLYCFHCNKFVWPVYIYSKPFVLECPARIQPCSYKGQELHTLVAEYNPHTVYSRIENGERLMEFNICVWCDKIFFNNGKGVNTNRIKMHVKIGHEKLYQKLLLFSCSCKKPLIITDVELYQYGVFQCGCLGCSWV